MKKILFIFFILYSVLYFVSPVMAQTATEEPKGSPLELTYPIIPNEVVPHTVTTGLPDYIKYIFNLAIFLIGIVIFGVLILNGLRWFASAGNADKLKTAKEGILSGFLGAIILFSAYVIFRTINPQLTILELKNPDAVEPVVLSGIYLCNYDIDSTYLQDLITKYMNDDQEKRLSATKEFKKIMDSDKGKCFRVNGSANFLNFAFAPQGGQNVKTKKTLFQIPEKHYSLDEDGKTLINWTIDYGIIFHQKQDMKGKCKVFVYDYKDGRETGAMEFHPDLGFNAAYSVTLFKKVEGEPVPESKGATIYECIDFNNASYCPGGVNHAGSASLSTEGKDYEIATSSDLMNFGLLTEEENGNEGVTHSKIRSIQIDPENYYFAVLFDADNIAQERTCQVVNKSDNNLLDDPIGQCGTDCNSVINNKNINAQELNSKCFPCTKSMLVIKGQII